MEDIEIDKSNEQQMHTNINNTSENHDNNNKKKAKKRKHANTESAEPGEIEEQMESELIKSKKKKLKNPSDLHSGEIESSNEKQSDVSLEGTQRKLNKCERNVSIKEEQVSDNCDENEQMVIDDSTILNNQEQENTNEKKKKRKKRKKQSKLEDFSYSIGLQIMAKKDWKCLRNKYLELQRSKMKQLKQHLRKTRWNQWSNYEKNKPERVENDEKDTTRKQNSISACRFSFTSGVIVKIEMDKPCTDPKSLKVYIYMSNIKI